MSAPRRPPRAPRSAALKAKAVRRLFAAMVSKSQIGVLAPAM